uniref:Uncharacterized protein n=1 Tax=Plectus sambesii TaxID=2011161 RepID=A0A914WTU3_9BILA
MVVRRAKRQMKLKAAHTWLEQSTADVCSWKRKSRQWLDEMPNTTRFRNALVGDRRRLPPPPPPLRPFDKANRSGCISKSDCSGSSLRLSATI